MQITVRGALVGAVANAYDFKNGRGEQVAGVARAVWLCESFDAEPVRVKLRQVDAGPFVEIEAAGFGALLDLVVDVNARAKGSNNAVLEYTLVSWELVADADGEVPAGRRRKPLAAAG